MNVRTFPPPPETGFQTWSVMVKHPDVRCPPPIRFSVPRGEKKSMVLVANPPGAEITCTCEGSNTASVVIVDTRDSNKHYHVANVIVRCPENITIANEATQIASALYWSWWRALEVTT